MRSIPALVALTTLIATVPSARPGRKRAGGRIYDGKAPASTPWAADGSDPVTLKSDNCAPASLRRPTAGSSPSSNTSDRPHGWSRAQGGQRRRQRRARRRDRGLMSGTWLSDRPSSADDNRIASGPSSRTREATSRGGCRPAVTSGACTGKGASKGRGVDSHRPTVRVRILLPDPDERIGSSLGSSKTARRGPVALAKEGRGRAGLRTGRGSRSSTHAGVVSTINAVLSAARTTVGGSRLQGQPVRLVARQLEDRLAGACPLRKYLQPGKKISSPMPTARAYDGLTDLGGQSASTTRRPRRLTEIGSCSGAFPDQPASGHRPVLDDQTDGTCLKRAHPRRVLGAPRNRRSPVGEAVGRKTYRGRLGLGRARTEPSSIGDRGPRRRSRTKERNRRRT